jgi:hypothetical protein
MFPQWRTCIIKSQVQTVITCVHETDLVVIGGATIKKLSTNIIECVDSLLDNHVFYDDA